MRYRNLAAIAATATVAATPTLATVLEDLTTAPPAAAQEIDVGPSVQIGPSCALFAPYGDPSGLYGYLVETGVFDKSFVDQSLESCKPGTLSLQASVDHSHWKTLSQRHESSWGLENADLYGPVWGPAAIHPCLSGTWWYQGYYAADDGSYKGGTDSAYPTQFTC